MMKNDNSEAQYQKPMMLLTELLPGRVILPGWERATQTGPQQLALLLLVVVCMSMARQVKSAEQEKNSFALWELRVKGNTLLETREIERAVYPFLGPNKTIDTVEQARSSLENLYRMKGYQTVAVDIPEQNVVAGRVFLQVSEGKVARLRVKDSHYFSLARIKAGVPALAEGSVPNLPKMQEQLAALEKQSTDRHIVPVLRAGETPGTMDVDLKVKEQLPLHGKLAFNGRNSVNTSRLRMIASLRYDNLWQKFHSASLMFQTAPENSKEVQVWAGTYVMPWFDSDARLAFYAVSSASDSNVANAGALAVIGNGNIYGLRLVTPLSGAQHYFHSLTAGVDYKDFKEDLVLIGSDTLTTPISYLPFMFQYSGGLRGGDTLLSFDVGINFSIRGLGNNEQQFEDKRFLARSNYFYGSTGLKFRYNLPWGFEWRGRFDGQLSDSPLISNEQFSLGGADSVRGYFESQALADNAIAGSLELYSPRLAPQDWNVVNKLRALFFIDGGQGWIKSPLPGNPEQFKLAGTGIGLRFQIWKYFTGALDLAWPLLDLEPIQAGDVRLDFNMAMNF